MWQGQQTYNFTTFSYTKKCITFFDYFAPDIFALRNFPVWFSKLVHRLGMIVRTCARKPTYYCLNAVADISFLWFFFSVDCFNQLIDLIFLS